MSAIPNELPVVLPDRAMPAPVLRTLVICDLADSTSLVEKLGDQRCAGVMRQHDRLARDLVERHHGREIDKTDGFLFLFERPIHAVAFALDYQRELRALSANEDLPLAARIGIHVGDVVLWDNNAYDVARGAKPVEVEGLVKPTAARIMSIARPGQILMSGMVSALAQRARAELGDPAKVRWQAHGNYRFKGVPDPVLVHEVGEEGIAPFRAPAWTGKAHREIPWWRRPSILFVEAAVVLSAVAIPAYFSLRSPPAIAFAERDWVVVGDLKNLTGQGVLDDSLDAAFRISLEQSRFVNLVSSLQLNDALKRMQKPDGTKIDRSIGAEIALREGARALILPSVAEVGGRVRVTAEVVDPKTQATVYAETADGVGLDSILPSVGKVSGELRGRLGEAVASIEANNAPLPKATTSNLDALRAYALGLQALGQYRYTDALAMFRQAIHLDPEFALAYIGIARIYVGEDDEASAASYISRAAALKNRLSARDRLYVEAWSAKAGPPGPMLDKWKLLGKLYPDYYAAHSNYAYFARQYENRYADAAQALKPSLSEHNAFRAGDYYALGSLLAAQEKFAEAGENFHIAETLGYTPGLHRASALAAQRQFAAALTTLEHAKRSGLATDDVFLQQAKMAIDLDQGHWESARAIAASITPIADKVSPFYGRVAREIELSVDDYIAPRAVQKAALREFISSARKAMDEPSATNHDDDVFAVLFGAYLAARIDEYAMAQTALTAATPQAHASGFPNLEHMLAIVEAELLRREGRPIDAVTRLETTVDGSELYLTHVALADAYAAAARNEDALKESKWLAAHHGQAYLEQNSLQLLQARNVVESDMALLRAAEQAHALSRDEEARSALSEFNRIWPADAQKSFVAARVQKLSQALHL